MVALLQFLSSLAKMPRLAFVFLLPSKFQQNIYFFKLKLKKKLNFE